MNVTVRIRGTVRVGEEGGCLAKPTAADCVLGVGEGSFMPLEEKHIDRADVDFPLLRVALRVAKNRKAPKAIRSKTASR